MSVRLVMRMPAAAREADAKLRDLTNRRAIVDGASVSESADCACAMTVEPGGHFVAVHAGETLLEVALRAGLSLPRSCRNGTCRACLCRIVEGEVRYCVEWPELIAEGKNDGWILPCVALPQSDVTIDQPAAHRRSARADSEQFRANGDKKAGHGTWVFRDCRLYSTTYDVIPGPLLADFGSGGCRDALKKSTIVFCPKFSGRARSTEISMTKILLKENEPFDVAMRRFRRTVERTGLIQELKSRMAYEKPTTERKRKKAAAVARLRKQIRRAQLPKKFY
ncbi:SSU ribosomal protein S21p [Candidatus Paraburkholderia calva]|nr:SSU ribosomal protein S21p [Candidatus Paraburkholderia calva]